MSGTLYVVATPIGNLEDITIRALRVLRDVSVIAAEDNRHAITTRTISFHAHNTRSRLPQLMSRLQAGEGVALVTDAGTPGVSDPGLELVQAAIAGGVAVEPIPGASAPLAALVASGFPLIPFTVFGFPPARSMARSNWLREVSLTKHVFAFLEAPHRIRETLREAGRYFGERQIMVGREVTKVHQEFLRGTSTEVVEELEEPRGEFTVIVGPSINVLDTNSLAFSDDDVVREFWRMTETGRVSRREAVRLVAQEFGRSSKDVYSLIERAKNGANNK